MTPFTHLHLHTAYSVNDATALIPDLVKRAKEMGMTSLALTDHGNLFGYEEFNSECRFYGIKPIFGCEMYVPNDDEGRRLHHLTLLAENNNGLENLIRLVDVSNSNLVNGKPSVSKESLQEYKDGLIALSGCIGGAIPRKALEVSYDAAFAAAIGAALTRE